MEILIFIAVICHPERFGGLCYIPDERTFSIAICLFRNFRPPMSGTWRFFRLAAEHVSVIHSATKNFKPLPVLPFGSLQSEGRRSYFVR